MPKLQLTLNTSQKSYTQLTANFSNKGRHGIVDASTKFALTRRLPEEPVIYLFHLNNVELLQREPVIINKPLGYCWLGYQTSSC